VTGILVLLLAVLWAAVLLPVLMSAKQNTSVSGSVGTFSRSMRALGSNHSQPHIGGRWVLTPRRPHDEEERKLTVLRRRRIFCALVGSFCFTLFLGLLPNTHFLLWAALASALGLGAFTAFLIQEKQRTPVHKRLATANLGLENRRIDDIPTVLRLAYTPPAPVFSGGRKLHRIADESFEDDGLGELEWLKAGRY
jgi:hypothetical protein